MARFIVLPFIIVFSGFICLEYGIPVAIGELMAGILGGHFFNFDGMLLPKVLSQIGMSSLMFLAGFEINLSLLKRNFIKSIFIGGTSFLVPFSIIYYYCLYLGLPSQSSLLIAIALSTTSLAIVFPSLREAGILAGPSGQLLLSSAMVVDIISMVGVGFTFSDFTVAKLILSVLVFIGIFFIEKLIIPIFKRHEGNRTEFELKFLLLVIVSINFLAEELGLHTALICFILGVIFSGIDPAHETIIERLSSVVFALLGPAFFFYTGTLISFSGFTITNIGSSLVLFLMAFSGKFIGTFIPLKLLRIQYSFFGANLFNYRLSFGLIAITYGLTRGIITNDYFNIVSLIILASSIVAGILEKRGKVRLEG